MAEEQIQFGIDLATKSSRHRLNQTMRLSFEYGASDILKQIQRLRETARRMAGAWPLNPDSSEHKKLIQDIDDTIKELQELKIDLEDKRGFFRTISTKNGTKLLLN